MLLLSCWSLRSEKEVGTNLKKKANNSTIILADFSEHEAFFDTQIFTFSVRMGETDIFHRSSESAIK